MGRGDKARNRGAGAVERSQARYITNKGKSKGKGKNGKGCKGKSKGKQKGKAKDADTSSTNRALGVTLI